MAKEELIQFEGLVTEILPDARYRVQLDAGRVPEFPHRERVPKLVPEDAHCDGEHPDQDERGAPELECAQTRDDEEP